MMTLLLLGFLTGMRHAMEADHLAAVASLATRSNSAKHAVAQGAVWGVGHTVTLFLFGGAVLALDSVMPERLAQGLESAVGIMLVVLGCDVLRRTVQDRLRLATDSERHASLHYRDDHRSHQPPFPVRALLVGLMHGMAGSAALILLTLQHVHSLWVGLAYIALFGGGSIAGMAMLSLAIAVPLCYSSKMLTGLHRCLQGAIGLFTVLLGAVIVFDIGTALAL